MRKIKKIQLLRHMIQLISFIITPGFFILVFGEIKYLYQSLLHGKFNFFELLPLSVELIFAFLFTVMFGRFFCGWICSFGTYNDLIYSISKNVFKTRFKVSSSLDSALKYVKYAILAMIIVISWTFGNKLMEAASPWEAFAQITDIRFVLSSLYLGLGLLLLITVGAFLMERFFCRYLCPLGAFFAIISKFSLIGIDMPKDENIACRSGCKACTRNCSMGIPLNRKNDVQGGECINCMNCIEACPSKNARASFMKVRIPTVLSACIAVVVVAGYLTLPNIGSIANVLALGNTAASTHTYQSSKDTYSNTSKVGSNEIKPEAVNNSVTATVSKGLNTKAGGSSLNSSNEKSGYNTASVQQNNKSSNSSLKTQLSTNKISTKGNVVHVDTVMSGTKTTSTKARSAVIAGKKTSSSSSINKSKQVKTVKTSNNSSSKAKVATATKTETSPAAGKTTASYASTAQTPVTNTVESSSNASTETNVAAAKSTSSKYKDGTYTGSGTGFRGGTTTVSITISNDKIVSVSTISSDDTPRFYERVEQALFDQILSSQSSSVDTISGATYSSEGIKAAVQDALNKAATGSN